MSDFLCIECHDPHFENSKSPLSTLKASTLSSSLQIISVVGAFTGILLAVFASIKIK